MIEAIRRTQDDCPSEPADKHLLETNNPTELRGVPGSLGNPGIQGQARGTVAPDPPPEPGFFGANATARAFQCCCPRAAGNGVGERSARSHVYGCKLPTGLPLKLFADHATGIPIPELAPVTDSRIRLEIPSRSKGGATLPAALPARRRKAGGRRQSGERCGGSRSLGRAAAGQQDNTFDVRRMRSLR